MTSDPRVDQLYELTEKVTQFLRDQGVAEEFIPLVFGAGFCASLMDFPADKRVQLTVMHLEQLAELLPDY